MDYDFLQVSLVDLSGVQRSKTLPRAAVHQAEKDGLAFYSGAHAMGLRCEIIALEELKQLKMGNQIIKLDLDSISKKPWLSQQFRVDHVFADVHWHNQQNGNYEPHGACSRSLAKQALQDLKKAGYSLYSGFEYEFMILDGATKKPLMTGKDVFNDLSIPAECRKFLYRSSYLLQEGGINMECFHREYGQGQIEFPLSPLYGIASADQASNFKTSMKELGQEEGHLITFMTKPFQNDSCNGAHFSSSLWDASGKKNVLYDPTEENNLSEVGRHWLGGIMSHLPAFLALCSPSYNCYRRLRQPWTPGALNWGVEDRSAALRVKNASEKQSYFENRLVSGPVNPFAVIAATVYAGLDGILNRIEPPEEGTAVKEMPRSLEEALIFLERDDVMMRDLGKFAEWHITVKRETEVKKFSGHSINHYSDQEAQVEREEYLMYA